MLNRSPAKQYQSISIIKAFACVSVVVAHWKAVFETMGSPRIDALVFDGPLVMLIYSSMGVSIFLMLSACLAALKIYRGQEIRPGEEVLKRYVRLSLPIFVTSLVVLILQQAGALYTGQAGALLGNDWIATRYTEPLRVSELFKISFVTALLREENSFYIPFWMISYIFLGSLVSMGLAFILRSVNRKGKVVIFAFLLLAMSILDSYYLCIVCGNLLAYLLSRRERAEAAWSSGSLPKAVIPGTLLLFCMWFSTRAYVIAWNINASGIGVPLNDSWFWQVIAGFGISAGFIFCYEELAPWTGKVSVFGKVLRLTASGLDLLGQLSYEVFLTHWFVICSFSCWFYVSHAAYHMHVSVLLNFILSFMLILFFSVLYHFLITKKTAALAFGFLRSRLL